MSDVRFKAKNKFYLLTRVARIEHDWCTPVEYLPYIDALLGDIELDPCTSEEYNKDFLRAKKIYTVKTDGLNTDDPWYGTTYCFPPTYGRCTYSEKRGTYRWSFKGGNAQSAAPSVIWFKRLEREWKLRNVPQALFFSTYHEMLRKCPEMWNYPICIPKDRANLIQGRDFVNLSRPFTWGFFIYLPPTDLSTDHVERFREIFSNIGNVIVAN
jgi:hypothetical protein